MLVWMTAVPLGAVGGVVWGLLSSFGAGIANASPTFKFDPYYQEHYYGSKTNAVRLVVMSFVKQGVVQVSVLVLAFCVWVCVYYGPRLLLVCARSL